VKRPTTGSPASASGAFDEQLIYDPLGKRHGRRAESRQPDF
jgi:hypothetical protein